ncbi:MAG: hypothetical protein WKG07_26710 [Hymenobacter sp.]
MQAVMLQGVLPDDAGGGLRGRLPGLALYVGTAVIFAIHWHASYWAIITQRQFDFEPLDFTAMQPRHR